MRLKIIIPILIIVLVLLGSSIFSQKIKTQNNPAMPSITSLTPTHVPSGITGVHSVGTPMPINQHAGWKTFKDPTQNVTFQYPYSLSTKYIRTQSWPPKITVSSSNFSCKESGQPTGQQSVTQKTIGNITYCIENNSEGAAGTIYSDYTYIFLKDNKLISLQLTIAFPQCANYPDPQKSGCQNERSSFDLNSLINQIAQTVN